MCSKLWRVTHALLTLTAVGCCAWLAWREYHRPDPYRHSSSADLTLRHFLDVRWIGGDYELPRGEEHCVVAVLRFEDGRFLGRFGGGVFSPGSGEPRVVPHYVMWGQGTEGKTRLVNLGYSSSNDLFFAKLDGGLGRSLGTASSESVRGYRVVGYAYSKETQAGKERYRDIMGDFDAALRTRRYVAVLGVKPFPTAQEAKDWLNVEERPDP